MKKYFIFGDSHGEFDYLMNSLNAVGYNQDNPEHFLIGLGDYFDRGNQNIQILEFLQQQKKKNRFWGILGNHDSMLYNFLTGKSNGIFDILRNGLGTTLKELAGLESVEDVILHARFSSDYFRNSIKINHPNLLEFLKSLKDEIKLGQYNLTHAGYSYNNETGKWEIDNWAMTEEFVESYPTNPEEIYVFGHWWARLLTHKFIIQEADKDITEIIEDDTLTDLPFRYKNFIGLDSMVNRSHFMNILVIKLDKDGYTEI